MPAYRYRAVHQSGRVTQGNLAAANEWELAQYLNHSGLELIDARVRTESQNRLRLWRSVPPRLLAVVASQTADLLKAGVPFIDALRDVAATSDPGPMREALTDIVRAIDHGGRIAAAFARYPRLFPPVFTAILAAGEASGDITGTFTHLTRYAEMRARTGEQLRRALRYPLFLLCVALGTVSFMMIMVVPQVIQFLNSINNQLPLMTRLLIAASGLFIDGWWLMLLAAALGAASLHFLRRHSESAALALDRLILRLPLLGTVLEKLAFARFAHSFSILFDSGIGILASLKSAKATLGNRALETMIDDVERQVQAGRSLSLAMTGLLPGFAIRMIRTGEHSGRLGKSLDDVAIAYDREATDTAERMIGSMEPALTILVGAILAWVVLAVLGPIYSTLPKLSVMH